MWYSARIISGCFAAPTAATTATVFVYILNSLTQKQTLTLNFKLLYIILVYVLLLWWFILSKTSPILYMSWVSLGGSLWWCRDINRWYYACIAVFGDSTDAVKFIHPFYSAYKHFPDQYAAIRTTTTLKVLQKEYIQRRKWRIYLQISQCESLLKYMRIQELRSYWEE